jgi:DNA-binding transcriptional regulator/RsmH inhibitor MraZ
MSPSLRHTLWLMIGLVASQWHSGTSAQTSAVPASLQSTSASVAVRLPLPPPFSLQSPINLFRKLLAMSPAERDQSLTNRPPENRKRMYEKIAEYQAMKPEERELRLRATQLRWYMLHFMQAAPVNRMAELAMISDAMDRQLVEDRLQQWDQLSPAEQKEVLDYESTMRTFASQPSDNRTNEIVKASSTTQQDELQKKLKDWQQLPAAQREEMYARFQTFFELTDDDKEKTLRVLPEVERQQMEKTLQTFSHLPKARRDQCIQSFTKFTNMTDEERQEFFRNAERWKDMSPTERQVWRRLVTVLSPQPPLPPGLGTPPLPHSAIHLPQLPAPVNTTDSR